MRTYDRLLAGHNPKTVRYLSEGWRHQREEATVEMRELEAFAALDPPPWAQVLKQFRAQLQATEIEMANAAERGWRLTPFPVVARQ